MITKTQFAEISFNEIDAARVVVGQAAVLSFDAVEDLEITGEIVEVDTVGTVTQGVVTYGVKIAFETQDERIRSGMSVSASITTDVRYDALAVPNSAVKMENNEAYVEIFDANSWRTVNGQEIVIGGTPRRIPVQIGISNDTTTEILSGISEGDRVVVRSTNSSAGSSSQPPSILGVPGGSSRGTFRMLR